MTILTKTTDKKKLLPIATPPIGAAPTAPIDPEAAAVHHARHQAREKTTTCLVCLMAILVLLMGVLAGVCFYRQYLREKVQRFNGYIPYPDRDVDIAESSWVNKYWHDGPMFLNDAFQADDSTDNDSDSDEDDPVMKERFQNLLKDLFTQINRGFNKPLEDMESEIQSLNKETVRDKFFREEIEVKDDDEDSYADIKIPDFKEGRRGRFIHDYKNNQTTIIDEDANRCFVYPLDYETTMPPKSIVDVFMKMQTGYYFPDTTTLNKKMRVVLPQLKIDDEYVSSRTALSCIGKRIYRMEPIVSGVYKRSIAEPLDDGAKFAEFTGKFVQYDIVNLNDVENYEKNY